MIPIMNKVYKNIVTSPVKYINTFIIAKNILQDINKSMIVSRVIHSILSSLIFISFLFFIIISL